MPVAAMPGSKTGTSIRGASAGVGHGSTTGRSNQTWREDTVAGLEQGSPVWVRHGTRSWRAATLLLASHSRTCIVALVPLDGARHSKAPEVRSQKNQRYNRVSTRGFETAAVGCR